MGSKPRQRAKRDTPWQLKPTALVVVQTKPRGAGPIGWPYRLTIHSMGGGQLIEWNWITLHDDGVSFTAGFDSASAVPFEKVEEVVREFLAARDEMDDPFCYEFRVTSPLPED